MGHIRTRARIGDGMTSNESSPDRRVRDLYERHWGAPGQEVGFTNRDSANAFRVIEFSSARVARIVTFGLGMCTTDDGWTIETELLFVLGRAELADIGFGAVSSYAADIAAHLLGRSIRPEVGSVIPQTSSAPWAPDAVVFDAPRGEAETIAHFQVGRRSMRILWAVPVYAAEARLVMEEGLDTFDALVEASDHSLADITRPPLLA